MSYSFHHNTALLSDLFIHLLIIYNVLCLKYRKCVKSHPKWRVESALPGSFALILLYMCSEEIKAYVESRDKSCDCERFRNKADQAIHQLTLWSDES